MSNINNNIYENIQIVMRAKGMSKPELAMATGINKHTIVNAFSKRTTMSIETLIKIAGALDCPVSDLIDGKLERYRMSYTFGRNLAALRSRAGMSQSRVAARLNVSQQTVTSWEHDKVRPSIERLVELCDVLNVSADQLLGRVC